MKRIRIIIVALLAVFFTSFPEMILAGGGTVIFGKTEVPHTSKTPKSIFLRAATGSAKPFSVGAQLAEIRLDNSASKGGAGMTGRLNTFRKFLRLDVRGVTALEQPAKVEVIYKVKEGEKIRESTDTITFGTWSANFLVDTEGFEDIEGTEVKTSSFIFSTSSQKIKYFSGEIIAADVTFFDKDGNKIYQASWPEAPTTKISLPNRFKPRTFTAANGRKMKAVVAEVKTNSAVFDLNRKLIEIQFSRFTKADQEYLRQIGKYQLMAPGGTPSSAMAATNPAAAPKPTATTVSPVPKKTGKPIGDLLASVSPSRRSKDGGVNVGGISIPLRFPASKIPVSYQVSFEVERISGTGAFLLGITNGNKPVVLKIDYRHDDQLRRCHGVGDGYQQLGPDGVKDPPPPAVSIGDTVEGTFDITPDKVTLSVSPNFQFSRMMSETKSGLPNPPAPFFVGAESRTEFLVKHLTIR